MIPHRPEYLLLLLGEVVRPSPLGSCLRLYQWRTSLQYGTMTAGYEYSLARLVQHSSTHARTVHISRNDRLTLGSDGSRPTKISIAIVNIPICGEGVRYDSTNTCMIVSKVESWNKYM